MTVPNPMTREELLEAAGPDAFGMLDEYETALFTRSLHHAPASVQNEILQLQAELVSDESLLPGELPDPSLRERVLGAVAQAVEIEAPQLEPLATIGRGSRAQGGAGEMRLHFAGSAPLWRAAAFVLCAGVIVMAYFWADAQRHANRIAELAIVRVTSDQLREKIGPDFLDFVGSPNVSTKVLRPEGDFPGFAVLYINEKTDSAFLIGIGLPDAGEALYTLRVHQGDGTVKPMKQFASSGSIHGLRLDNIPAATLSAGTWDITNSSGRVVLRSA